MAFFILPAKVVSKAQEIRIVCILKVREVRAIFELIILTQKQVGSFRMYNRAPITENSHFILVFSLERLVVYFFSDILMNRAQPLSLRDIGFDIV
jgi:hypothetical protein